MKEKDMKEKLDDIKSLPFKTFATENDFKQFIETNNQNLVAQIKELKQQLKEIEVLKNDNRQLKQITDNFKNKLSDLLLAEWNKIPTNNTNLNLDQIDFDQIDFKNLSKWLIRFADDHNLLVRSNNNNTDVFKSEKSSLFIDKSKGVIF